jgi:hypothetical protein
MKLYLNENQRNYLLEILKASESNATGGKDMELALAFRELYDKITLTNLSYVSLKRDEAETLVEFCEIVRTSLDKAISFLEKDKERSEEEVDELKTKATFARDEIESIAKSIQEKIKANPV